MARRVIEAVSREFPSVSLELDFDTPRDDHEDAYLWITPDSDEREEVNELWAFVVHHVQAAFDEEDVYLVARVRGVGPIIRDRPQDKE